MLLYLIILRSRSTFIDGRKGINQIPILLNVNLRRKNASGTSINPPQHYESKEHYNPFRHNDSSDITPPNVNETEYSIGSYKYGHRSFEASGSHRESR